LDINQTDRIAVFGYGVTGRSVVRYLVGKGLKPIVLDTRSQPDDAEILEGVTFLWEVCRWPDLSIDTLVVSPGLRMDACLVRKARSLGVAVVSDIDLFMGEVTAPVIGITGTNGKSTVTALVAHVLNEVGISCSAGGNLGEAALDLLHNESASFALELSSFQLERSHKLALSTATILNISEDHLDHHKDFESYVASKHSIYTDAELCVYNRDDLATRPIGSRRSISFGLSVPSGSDDWGIVTNDSERWLAKGKRAVVRCSQLPLTGRHNELNVMAALALVSQLCEIDLAVAALSTFQGLPHRFEIVGEHHGVTFINDSKATNLGSTVAALEGQPKSNHLILIAGGDAKGVDLSPLGAVMRDRVKVLVSIGADGPQLSAIAQLEGIPAKAADTMQDAVAIGVQLSVAGDIVLLSPACASLDMFNNFKERGEHFAAAVEAAVGGEA
jgi:UDP-N-acetylmuramoylalanine--D-glutamate ligase